MIRTYCDNPNCRAEVHVADHTRSLEVAPGASVYLKVVVTGGHFCLKCVIGLLSREISDD